MDLQKVSTIYDRVQLSSHRNVRSLLGFYKIYQHFIWDFSILAKHFTSLTKKNSLFDQTLVCQSAFDSLKKIVTKAQILAYYKQAVKIILEINSSDYVNSRVLTQLGDNGLLYPILIFYKNLNSAKYN